MINDETKMFIIVRNATNKDLETVLAAVNITPGFEKIIRTKNFARKSVSTSVTRKLMKKER